MLVSKIEKIVKTLVSKVEKKSWKRCETKIEKSRENVGVKNRKKIVKTLRCASKVYSLYFDEKTYMPRLKFSREIKVS